MVGGAPDFLTAAEKAGLAADVATLMGDGQVSSAVTWHHHAALDPQAVNPFAQTIEKVSVTEVVSTIRGHVRDSLTGDIVAGRYHYLISHAGFASGDPDTDDVFVDAGATLLVMAVERDDLLLVWKVSAVRVTDGGL